MVELLVVTAILIVISSLILVNNNRFSGQILLENLGYDIALSVRQAQVYGISVHSFGGTFTAGYGMHFERSSPTTYVLFADAVLANGLYDGSAELVTSTTIQGGYTIADLCSTPSGSSVETCGLDALDILFKRPEPDAYISANSASGILTPAALYESGRIILASPQNARMSVVVEATGQISVQ